MARCKVYNDVHGLYIRAGGYIFRPDFPVGYKHLENDCGAIKQDDKVNANHCGGTSLGTVKNPETGVTETWYVHGPATSYSRTIKTKSEDIFRPSYDKWQ